MQPCLPVAKARRSWHAWSAWAISEPEAWAIGMHQIEQGSPNCRIGMVETTEKTGDKTLSVTPTKTFTLKPRGVEQGVVRQSFSHGRTKAVVVEKVKRRVGPGAKTEAAPTTVPTPAKRSTTTAKSAAVSPTAAPVTVSAQTHGGVALKPSGLVLPTLTEEEQKARGRALADARLREAEERKIAEEDARIRQAREAIDRTEREAAEARKREEEERRRHEDQTKRKAEQEAKKRFGEDEAKAKLTGPLAARAAALEAEEEEAPRPRRGGALARP